MAIGDRIRERRERRRAEDGLFNSTMSILYGNNWANNGRIDPRQMRKQYDANRDMFLRQASNKAVNTSFDPAIEDIQMPELSIQQTTVQQAPTPKLVPVNTTPNYNPRFFRSRQNQDWWLRQANEAGKDFGGKTFKTIEDVMNFQKELGMTADGKLSRKEGNQTYLAAKKQYNNQIGSGESSGKEIPIDNPIINIGGREYSYNPDMTEGYVRLRTTGWNNKNNRQREKAIEDQVIQYPIQYQDNELGSATQLLDIPWSELAALSASGTGAYKMLDLVRRNNDKANLNADPIQNKGRRTIYEQASKEYNNRMQRASRLSKAIDKTVDETDLKLSTNQGRPSASQEIKTVVKQTPKTGRFIKFGNVFSIVPDVLRNFFATKEDDRIQRIDMFNATGDPRFLYDGDLGTMRPV